MVQIPLKIENWCDSEHVCVMSVYSDLIGLRGKMGVNFKVWLAWKTVTSETQHSGQEKRREPSWEYSSCWCTGTELISSLWLSPTAEGSTSLLGIRDWSLNTWWAIIGLLCQACRALKEIWKSSRPIKLLPPSFVEQEELADKKLFCPW